MKLTGIYNLPGEGLVVELRSESDSFLFDRQGLQHRILSRKQQHKDTSVEEAALTQMNSLSGSYDLNYG